jgi:ferredoxin
MTATKIALRYFREEFETVIRDKRDPARSLPGLIRYQVRNQGDEAMAEAKAICPTRAISGDPGGYAIDDELCIRCGACKEVAPAAIEVVDRYAVPMVAGASAAGA